MKYELCYLVGESKEQDLPKIKEEVSNIVTHEGGKFSELQVEEKRKMAYKVEKEIRGIYVTQQFEIYKDEDSEEDIQEAKNPINSISRKINLNQNVLRFIIVKADDLPELKVREAKVSSFKAGEGRETKKPVYVKKSEPAKEKKEAAEKIEEVKPEEAEIKEGKEEKKEKDEKESKSIDEKIDEILNI
jgi:ribosomal protein S6